MKFVEHKNPDGTISNIYVGNYTSIGDGARIGNYASIGSYAKVVSSSHATRSDGYVFTVCDVKGEQRVFAGCRDFNSAEAKKHWNTKHKHYAETKLILALLFRE